jgi:hypothetical protein
MATLLDAGLIEIFVPLVTMIFVFLVCYAILQQSKILGGKNITDFFIALMVSILVFFSSSALELTKFMSVWLVVVLIIIIFMVIIVSFFKDHAGESESMGFPADLDIKGIVFWALIIVLAVGLTQVFGPILTPYAADADPNHVILRTLFHPRLIGAVILLIVISNLAKLLKHEA